MPASKADIAMRLHRVAIHLLRTVRTEDLRMGVSPARASVLSILVFGGPRTLTQLTAAEQVAAPTMTKLVAGLERDGYVAREPSAEDGRAWVISATAKARRTLKKGRDRRVARLLELLAGSSPEDWIAIEKAAVAIERALHR